MPDLYYDPVFLDHITGNHPESPERLEAVMASLRDSPAFPNGGPRTGSRVAMEALYRVHSPAYVNHVEWFCARGGGAIAQETELSAESYDVALRATGACVEATERVVRGDAASAFCAIRPPGHHAARSAAMGFCIFNNVAVAAAHARAALGVERVAIIDWDVHHGNGTHYTFEEDPSVFFLSLHLFPHFPWVGAADERGEGAGLGATLNVEVARDTGPDDYLKLFATALESGPAEFRPDLIFISAGFDAAEGDPAGGLRLNSGTFARMTDMVVELARSCGHERIVSILEGGYDPDSLAQCVRAHFERLP